MLFFIGREYCGQKNLCQEGPVTPLVISVARGGGGAGSGCCAPAAQGSLAGWRCGEWGRGRSAESLAVLGLTWGDLGAALAPTGGQQAARRPSLRISVRILASVSAKTPSASARSQSRCKSAPASLRFTSWSPSSQLLLVVGIVIIAIAGGAPGVH